MLPQRAATRQTAPRSTSRCHAQCTDNLPPSVIYTIIRLGRAGNTAERAGTNVEEGDHNRQQRARGASKRKKQQPREPRQPRKQLAAYTLIPFAVITGRHAAGAGLLPPTPVCPAAVCTAPIITTCAAHPGLAPKAAKRQLARQTARLSDLKIHIGEEYRAKYRARDRTCRDRAVLPGISDALRPSSALAMQHDTKTVPSTTHHSF